MKGTDLERSTPPKTEDMIPGFRRLYEACLERALSIGCAPNVHVSLVMLPEECRTLSPRRFPWQNLKLKAMAKVFAGRFGRRLAAKAEMGRAVGGAGGVAGRREASGLLLRPRITVRRFSQHFFVDLFGSP